MTAGPGPVRVGIIGAGVMGADHARILHDLVDGAVITGLCDPDPARVAVAAGLAPTAEAYDDAAALISSAQVDAVLVASSDATHEEYVLACVEAGKPVLCEKPLAPTAEACLRIVEAERLLGRRLVSVGFMRRYDPGYVRLRDADLGPTLLLHCRHRNASSRPGWPTENLIVSSAVHEFDVIRWLTGEEIVEVEARVPRSTSRATGGTRDPLLLIARTTSGILADIEVFVNTGQGYDVFCERVAENGSADLGVPAGARYADWRDRFADAYRDQLTDWVAGVARGATSGAGAADGYAAQLVCDAAVEALRTGGTVGVPRMSAGHR